MGLGGWLLSWFGYLALLVLFLCWRNRESAERRRREEWFKRQEWRKQRSETDKW